MKATFFLPSHTLLSRNPYDGFEGLTLFVSVLCYGTGRLSRPQVVPPHISCATWHHS